MSKRIEIEQKFYLESGEKFIEIIDANKFVLKENNTEVDEYFTDINSLYIKNRTCLRIRKTNDEIMELTFKGKSLEFNNFYAKTENNVDINISEYESLVSMLKSIGYLSYTIVDKKRYTYSKTIDDIEYNIMIDNIKGVGDFVEFEILSNDEYADVNDLKNKLNDLMKIFEEIKFQKANLPYRDFVAQKLYSNISCSDNIECLMLDLDGTLIDSEKVFYTSFRDVLKNEYNIEININDYVENELNADTMLLKKLKESKKLSENIDDKEVMEKIYNDYKLKFEKLITSVDSIINFELLKKIKEKNIKLALITTSKNDYIDILKKNLNIDKIFDCIISRENVTKLKPSNEIYIKALNELNIKAENCIAFEDSKKGIESAINANINAIHINGYNLANYKLTNTYSIDYIQRVLLILLNNIK
ncbi:MAG: HAD-IA family hydrolase [Bacilli bacterium]